MKLFFFKYLIFCILIFITTWLLKHTLHVDDLLYNSLSGKLTIVEINKLITLQAKWEWIGYIFIPIYLLMKTIIISSILNIGVSFFCKNDIAFKYIWSCVINSEFIFLLVPIFKISWFYVFQTNFTLEDIQCFYPLSALNITGYKGIDPWLLYPLQTLNLFEVAYIIYLSYQIGSLTKTNADIGLKIVGYSYVPSLLLWVAVVMFVTLNYS